MNLILCDDDKVFLNKLEIRIRGLCQKHKIAVKMECYVSAKEMLEGIKNLDEISVFFIDIDMPEVNGFEAASYLKKWNRECCIVFVSNKDDLVFQDITFFETLEQMDLKKRKDSYDSSSHLDKH